MNLLLANGKEPAACCHLHLTPSCD